MIHKALLSKKYLTIIYAVRGDLVGGEDPAGNRA
jgi:hypothetical protein